MEIKEGTKNKERTHEYRKKDGTGGMKEQMKEGKREQGWKKKGSFSVYAMTLGMVPHLQKYRRSFFPAWRSNQTENVLLLTFY